MSPTRRRSGDSVRPTIPFARPSARISSPRSADSWASTEVDFSTARDLIAGAVDRRVTPAAVAEVGRAHGAIWRESFGRLTYAADAAPAELDTIFDLASLTKVMASAPMVMRAIIEGRLTLDSKVGEFLDGWSDG